MRFLHKTILVSIIPSFRYCFVYKGWKLQRGIVKIYCCQHKDGAMTFRSKRYYGTSEASVLAILL